MFELGKTQTLKVVKIVEFGVYLTDPEMEYKEKMTSEDKVLLPKSQTQKDVAVGDLIKVFLYKDSKDRLIATVRTPEITLGEVGKLTVASVTKIGAFLDWGLEKDLFLPFHEQTYRVKTGDEVLVALYIDKSERLCATMKIYHYLLKESPYKMEDKVEGTLYEISDNFGAFVAVDDKYSALIPKREFTKDLPVGSHVSARVVEVRDDGKLTLAIREKAYMQIASDSDLVMKAIESYDGILPFNDKASPETIKREMNMSKNEFKRAVGNLLKMGRIEITPTSIRKIDSEK